MLDLGLGEDADLEKPRTQKRKQQQMDGQTKCSPCVCGTDAWTWRWGQSAGVGAALLPAVTPAPAGRAHLPQAPHAAGAPDGRTDGRARGSQSSFHLRFLL